MSKETIAAAILVEAYWNAAYQQGLEHREVDDEKGTAQAAETALAEYIAKLQTEAKHWRDQHANEVKRAKILKDTTDLPLERVRAYELMGELQGQVERLTAKAAQVEKDNMASLHEDLAIIWNLQNERDTSYEKGAESMRERVEARLDCLVKHLERHSELSPIAVEDNAFQEAMSDVESALDDIRALPLKENDA